MNLKLQSEKFNTEQKEPQILIWEWFILKH